MADANMYIMNPVFQAESFNEMVQPLALYALAYKEQEAKIEDMTDKAAALEWIANQNPESQTAALYRDMSTKIKGIRDDMMVNGLQGGTRSRILGARRMYSANSAEITRRYEDMKKYQERMEQLYDKDNSIVFSPESLNVSLDDFAGGKRPKIKAISGNEIMARGAAIGKRLTSQVFGDGVEGLIMGGLFWKYYQENGMTDKALDEALSKVGQSDKFSMFKQVMDGVYNSFSDFDPASQQILKNRFIEGVYSGAVYNKQVSPQQNLNFESDAARDARLFQKQMAQNQDRRAQEQHNAQMKIAGATQNADGTWDVSTVVNPYGKTGTGNGSGSGGSSEDGGGSSSRVGIVSATYMRNSDDGPQIAAFEKGKPVDINGEPVDEKGLDITFKYEDNKLKMYHGSVLYGSYNPEEDNITDVRGTGNAKVLKQLGREAARAANNSPGSYGALIQYRAKFHPDDGFFKNNASYYFGPAIERAMPVPSDTGYGGYFLDYTP